MIELTEDMTGRSVHLARAQAKQRCPRCGVQMHGRVIAAVEGGEGWFCAEHLFEELSDVRWRPAPGGRPAEPCPSHRVDTCSGPRERAVLLRGWCEEEEAQGRVLARVEEHDRTLVATFLDPAWLLEHTA